MFNKYNNKGISGLKNIGNSCYMNTAIQCLSHTLELTEYFLMEKYTEDYNKNSKYSNLVTEWYKLLVGIYEENCKISPVSFYKTSMTIANENNIDFGYYNENDVQEFLIFFIDGLHEALKREVTINISGEVKNNLDKIALESMIKWKEYFKNCYSKIIELFYGQMITFIEVDDNVKSKNYNPICFFTLPIKLKNNVSVYDCFEKYTETEVLDGDNKWYCDKNNKFYKASKKTLFWKFPTILIISFKS